MTCPACQHENRDGAKFCEECAAPLKRACASCGTELRPTAKFCDECSAPAGATTSRVPAGSGADRSAASDDGTRKVVSIVFADLAGSTALHERLDAESARSFMESYYRAMRGAVEAHGGKVAKLLGDGVMAVFGLPLLAEDDALRAVKAAVQMQRAFRELAEWHRGLVGKVGLRVAVNTGEVVARDETELIGDPVNVAARLQDQARDGDVVIGESTRRLVSALVTLEPLGSLALKGRAEAVGAYRVVSLERPASATTAAFVGRDAELARLAAVHKAVTSTPATRLAVLLGPPGLGKSRLIEEFVRRAGDRSSVIAGHCDASGGTSFAPVTQAVRRFLGIDDGATADSLRAAVDQAVSGEDSDRSRIVDGITALLSGSPASPEETFFVVRRLLAALAATRPVVLVLDDAHWAEPLLLDLVEHLVQWGSGVPLFVLLGARSDLRDARSSLTTTGPLVADVVTLTGLDAGAAMRLAANMIGAADLPAAVAAKVLASSEGNPLFVGELVRMLVHEGALRREGDRWTVGVALAALEMPPTIHALLAARIERLRPEERLVLERAAVVGRHFSRAALAALLPRDVADLDARLESLRRSELIERDTGWFLGEPVLRFHHLLIRDAAYRRLLKGTRAELHGKLADWIEARVGDAVEHDETIGWHLEQSCQHLRELGPLDDRGRALGEKAAGYLASAGRRALVRDDLSLAAGLLGRALACLDAADPSRADLALDWCEAVLAAGDVAIAATAIDELHRFIGDSPRLRAWHTCFAGQLTALTAPQSLNETVEAVAAAAVELATLGDDAGEAKAHAVHAQTLARLGRIGACEAALDRALAAARKAGDRRRANAVLAGAPVAALWGPSPVTRASGRCLDVVRVLRITQGAPAVEAVALSCQGVLEALRGRTDAAKRMIALSRKMVEELGISHRLFEADVFAGRIDLLEGDGDAAERRLRSAYEGLRELGLGIDAARAAALLARALLVLGRADEAETLSHESETLAGDDLQAAIAWRGVRAQALARRGQNVAAVELAEAAVAIAAATDGLLDHADARLALAAALRACGRGAEADGEERHAIELWETKGATLLAERARGSAATTSTPAAEPEDIAAVHAHLDGLLPATPAPPVRPNAATLNLARFAVAFAANDIDAVAALYADDVVNVHHPTGITFGKAAMIESWTASGVGSNPSCQSEALASFGDTLCLARQLIRIEGVTRDDSVSMGPIEHEMFVLIEVNDEGRRRRNELFAMDHLEHAIARLYEFRAESLPEGAGRDRAATMAGSLRLMLLENPDPTWRFNDVVHLGEFSLAAHGVNTGTDSRGGGDFEREVSFVWSFGPDGRLAHAETFEAEDAAKALARLDELKAGAADSKSRSGNETGREAVLPTSPFDNLASRTWRRMLERWIEPARTREESSFTDDFRYSDRRRLSQVELTLDEFTRFSSGLATMPSRRIESSLLATRGERLALSRLRLEVAGDDVGPSEIEHLNLAEVNAEGLAVALVRFDLEDLDAAVAELAVRYEAGEAAAYPRPSATLARYELARVRRDWEALSAQFHPDLVTKDHRLLGWGTLQGREAFVQTQRTLVDLAPDTSHRVPHTRTSAHGYVAAVVITGTRDGGSYELPSNTVMEIDGQGLIRRVEIFDDHDHERALGLFGSLGKDNTPDATRGPAPDSRRIPPNAATRMHAKLVRTHAARDWEGMRRLASDDFRFEDRSRRVLVDGDVDTWLKSMQFVVSHPGVRFEHQLYATLGDRILVGRLSWIGESREAEFLTDKLRVIEVAADGRLRCVILFDHDDRPAAMAEALDRFVAGEAGSASGPAAYAAFSRSLLGLDWEAMGEILAPGFVFDDRRPLSLGILSGEQWVESLRVQADMAPDLATEVTRVFAWNDHGYLVSIRTYGNLRDGGPFENVFLSVLLASGGKLVHVEPHPIDALEAAIARFEELCAALDAHDAEARRQS